MPGAARRILTDDDPRSFYERNRDRAAAAGQNMALKHLGDIVFRGKKPSRDQSTWGDRTGAEDQKHEQDERREKSLRGHRTKASFFGIRG